MSPSSPREPEESLEPSPGNDDDDDDDEEEEEEEEEEADEWDGEEGYSSLLLRGSRSDWLERLRTEPQLMPLPDSSSPTPESVS